MSVQERMRMCRLIDKMEEHREYSIQLGLENKSYFHGNSIENITGEKRGKEK